MSSPRPPLVAHIIFRLDIGGLENGLVNLINRMPAPRYRHAIICLTNYSAFARRIERPDVEVHTLGKRPGKDVLAYFRLWRLLRRLRPDIVHTRNLAALDCQVVAAMARVPRRVHGEHGWDIYDLHGTSPKYRRLRRLCSHLIHRYVAMSRHLCEWLTSCIGIESVRIRQIYSGVDEKRFTPRVDERRAPFPEDFAPPGTVVIGTVGRMEPVKDQLTLARAFVQLVTNVPAAGGRLRLVLIGAGPLREQAAAILDQARLTHQAWLPGARDDVPQILRALDIFVLPSLNEGISNTILEAMASGLPVVATRVGGNPELVEEGVTGNLCAPADPAMMAEALAAYVRDAQLRTAHGRAARRRVESSFSLAAMVDGYLRVYDELMEGAS